MTGLQSIYVNTTFTTKINELSWDESRVVLDYLFRLQHESHDAHVKYHWRKHDVSIWDNSTVNQYVCFSLPAFPISDTSEARR